MYFECLFIVLHDLVQLLSFVNVGIIIYQVIYCSPPFKVESRLTKFQVLDAIREMPTSSCLVAVLDVAGRHGPLRLAQSVLRQSPGRSPSEFVVSSLPL